MDKRGAAILHAASFLRLGFELLCLEFLCFNAQQMNIEQVQFSSSRCRVATLGGSVGAEAPTLPLILFRLKTKPPLPEAIGTARDGETWYNRSEGRHSIQHNFKAVANELPNNH